MQEKYAQLALENTVRLLGIDSPSGLDDKLSVGILQAFAQYLKDENLTPSALAPR